MELSDKQNLRLPWVITDKENGISYILSELLGKGSFAKCYSSKEVGTEKLFAVKVVSSSTLSDEKNCCYIRKEIAIHSLLNNNNIVSFKETFTDNSKLYIVLELCSNGSLNKLMNQRGQLTMVEAKYMLKHILSGVQYLHDNNIVHGDLKLGNILLSSRLIPKIGDFGLSTVMSRKDGLITEFCGTMNYMAPEIINHEGHSFPVDIWAVGCILYKMISGKLPFETNSRSYKDVKENILNCEYDIYHPGLRKQVSNFIMKILREHPSERPSADDLLQDEFLSNAFIPSFLPLSCLWEPPLYRDFPSRRPGTINKCQICKLRRLLERNRKSIKTIKKIERLSKHRHK